MMTIRGSSPCRRSCGACAAKLRDGFLPHGDSSGLDWTRPRKNSHAVRSRRGDASRTRGRNRTSGSARISELLVQLEIRSRQQLTRVDALSCIRTDHGYAIEVSRADRSQYRRNGERDPTDCEECRRSVVRPSPCLVTTQRTRQLETGSNSLSTWFVDLSCRRICNHFDG